MKVVFIYTNNNAPQVDVFNNATKVELTTDNDGNKWINISYLVENVIAIAVRNPVDGQVSIFWE